jgi:elongation factor G
MAHGIAAASVFPVVCGSAIGPIAVDRLADFIVEIGPSPLDRPAVEVEAGDQTVPIERDPGADPLAFAFKTIADPYVGQISLLKVVSGSLKPESTLTNVRSGADERLARLVSLQGKETDVVASAPAGDIVAVVKLTDTRTGDTLAPKHKPVRISPTERPEPVLATAVKAKTQADEDKLANALHRVLEEDNALRLERSSETKQTLLWGMGETHLAITLERLSRKFGVGVETEPVRVAYRETISRSSDAEGKYKKQTGGHGQFGVCFLKMEPQRRGEGFEFVDEIRGGSVPRQFIPAVEKGITEAMADGGPRGYPVVDVRVRLYDGKYHSVDSSEMSFKMAGRLGFRAAMGQASPIVLEPISKIRVTVPAQYQGDVMGDLSSRRGQLQGTELAPGGRQQITALVPTSEVINYAIDLRSLSHGWGIFSATHDHYQELPSHLADQLKSGED